MSQENHFQSTFQSDRSWSVLNDNLIDDDDKHRFYPSFSSEKSWSVLGSQDVDDRPFGVSTYGYAEDENSKVHEYIRDQQRFTPLPPVPERTSSFPEPEFVPSVNAPSVNASSLNASTKEFLEYTFKCDRKNDEDFVGRPNEFDDECCSPPPPPPPQFFPSSFTNDGLDSDQTAMIQGDQIRHDDDYQSSQITVTDSSNNNGSNRMFVWTSIMVIIAIIFYYVLDDIPIGELEYYFS